MNDTKTAPLFDGLPEKLARLSKFAADVTAKTLARKTHPETSRETRRAIVPKLGKLHAEVLLLLRRFPGRTANEYAKMSGHRDTRHIGRRLPELVEHGKARRCGTRKCEVTGRSATTWEAV